jgi:hypothetical protein
VNRLIGVHSRLWVLILSLLVQILRPAGIRAGVDLQPITADKYAATLPLQASKQLRMISPADVVAFDLEWVAVDLTLVPLDEILDFRRQHGASYRAYADKLRTFLLELSLLPEAERQWLWVQRADETIEAAHALRRTMRTAWRQPSASIALGILGAAYAAHQQEWPAALISLLAGGAGASFPHRQQSAFTYLFEIQSQLSSRSV